MTKLPPVFLLALAIALTSGAYAKSSSSSSSRAWSSQSSSNQSSSSQSSSSSSHSSLSSSSSHHSDQDQARDALRKGKIMPLTAILEIVAKREPGTVMEVELETKNGKLTYRIEVLADSGRRRELRLDARNGDVLWAGDD
jgi:hypothetical protein